MNGALKSEEDKNWNIYKKEGGTCKQPAGLIGNHVSIEVVFVRFCSTKKKKAAVEEKKKLFILGYLLL